MHSFKQWKALFIVTFVVALASPAFGQAVYGTIYGTVTDPTGAAVPDATITVTDETKGTSVTATSNGSGAYSVACFISPTTLASRSFATFRAFSFPYTAM